MSRIVNVTFSVLFLVAASASFAAPPDGEGWTKLFNGKDLPGLYACKGTNPDGSAYEGRVEIARKGDIYNLTWKVGETQYVGVALLEGDVLSVAWGIPGEGGTAIGVVAYKIEKGGTLTGRWTVLGAPKVMTEKLNKIPDA